MYVLEFEENYSVIFGTHKISWFFLQIMNLKKKQKQGKNLR